MVSKPMFVLILILIGWGTANANEVETLTKKTQTITSITELSKFVSGVEQTNTLTANTNDEAITASAAAQFSGFSIEVKTLQNEVQIFIHNDSSEPITIGYIIAQQDDILMHRAEEINILEGESFVINLIEDCELETGSYTFTAYSGDYTSSVDVSIP